MASQEQIDELISPKALQGFDLLNEKVNTAVTGLERMIATGVDLNKAFAGGTTFKATNDGAAKLSDVEAQLAKMTADLANANAKLLASYSDQAQQLANVKVQQQAVNKANNDAAKEALGTYGAFDRLNAQYVTLVKNARNIGAQFGENSKEFKEAAVETAALGEKLRVIDLDLKQFGRNVGNYAGSLGGAFAVLQKELQNVQQKIKETDSGSQAFSGLAKQEQFLTSLTENLNQGFSTTRQELRAYQEAAKQLGLEVGLSSNAFIQFSDEVGKTKNELDDVQKVLNYKASDTKFLTGAIAAVQGLAGVYSAAQGAAQLFGDETGDLQKQFVKLQAIMAIVQGLQSVQNALQTESGAIQLGLAAKTALLNAAMLVQNALMRTNTVAATQNAVAQGETALATGGAAAAMEAEAVAAGTATVATTAFSTALIATGIGAIILAIGVAIAFVASKVADWVQGNKLTIQQQLDLADTIGKANQALADQGSVLTAQAAAERKYFEDQATYISAAGQNTYKQLAAQKALAVFNIQKAKEEIARLGATNAAYAKNGSDYEMYNNKKREALEQLIALQSQPNKDLTRGEKDAIEAIQKLVDLYGKQADAVKSLYDAQTKARTDLQAGLVLETATRIQTEKFTQDELRKLALTEAELEADAVKNKNQIILSDDRSTQAQRLAALKSNAAAERALLQAQTNDVRKNPASTGVEIAIAEKQQAEKVKTIRADLAESIYNLNLQYFIKDRQARLLEIQSQLNDTIKANDILADNEKKSFDVRFSALVDSLAARRKLIIADRDEQLAAVGLTAEQRKAIEVKAAYDIAALTIDYGQKQLALYKNNEALVTAAIEKEVKKRADIIGTKNADNIGGLTKQLLAGQITLTEYGNKRALQEAQNNIDAAQEAVKAEFAKVNATKAGTAERAAAEKDLADKTVALQDAVVKKTATAQQQLLDNIDKVGQYFDEVAGVIGSAFDASITAQKNQLADQTTAIQANAALQIQAINSTADTAESKAAKIAVVNADAQAKQTALDQKQKQLDIQKAEFDKQKAVADIIISTAKAVAKALGEGDLALAYFYGGLGAAELAIAEATPIPRFATGTMDAPGGDALVGDGGRSEMIVTPDGRLVRTPAKPTVMNVPKHSVIFPDAEEFKAAAIMEGNGGRVPTTQESKLLYAEMVGVGAKLDKLTRVVQQKEVIHLHPHKDGWEKIKNHGGQISRYLNKM